jgi:hypothetical protein
LPTVDLSIHGGARTVERVILVLQRRGATLRLGGALDGGALDDGVLGDGVLGDGASVIEEADAALCRVKTRRAARFVARQRVLLPAALEALRGLFEKDADAGRAALVAILDRSRGAHFLVDGATVALFGPTNAGKSTLIRALADSAESIVSEVAGTTRDWVSADGAIEGVPIRWIDTAGDREGADGLEREALFRGLAEFGRADVRVLVMDGSVAFPVGFVDRYREMWGGERLIWVRTKDDLPCGWGEEAIHCGVGGGGVDEAGVISLSAVSGVGVAAFVGLVLAALAPCGFLDEVAQFFSLGQYRRFSEGLSDVSGDRIPKLLDLALKK